MTANQISPGITLAMDDKIYRVDSCVKVAMAKGVPFIKVKLKDLVTDEVVEKNLKPDQAVHEVSMAERRLEYLYLEGKDYLFLDVGNLEQVLVPSQIIADKINYLKEGVELKAMFYGNAIFSVELPQFLELLVVKIEESSQNKSANPTRVAVLETGAKLDVPPFVESGDVIKVDTQTNEYIQRV